MQNKISKKNEIKHDIVILGGGMVGLTAFVLLAQQGWNVALVERRAQSFNPHSKLWPSRVVALGHASQQILQAGQAWDAILAADSQHGFYEKMMIVDEAGGAAFDFDSADIARSELGFIVSNEAVCQGLSDRAQVLAAEGRGTIYSPADPVILQANLGDIHLQLQCSQSHAAAKKDIFLSAALLIAADGVNSASRQQLGVKVIQRSYAQHALVAVVKHQLPHHNIARQIFLNTGPLAFLPLGDPHHSSIVWSTSVGQADLLKQKKPQALAQALDRASAYRLGRCSLATDVASFPLQSQHVTDYERTGVVFVGDAAHRLHPLAGQGANVGFADVACLCRNLKPSAQTSLKTIKQRMLRAYARERQACVQSMICAMDVMHESFCSQSSNLASVRGCALGFIDKQQWLKQWMMQWVDQPCEGDAVAE